MKDAMETIRNTRAHATESSNRGLARELAKKVETVLLRNLDEDTREAFQPLLEAEDREFVDQLISRLERLGTDRSRTVNVAEQVTDELFELFKEWMNQNDLSEQDFTRNPKTLKRDWINFATNQSDMDAGAIKGSFTELVGRL